MVFTRIVAALFATAVCAQALYIPTGNGQYARDLEVSRNVATRELSERGVNPLNAIRDLAARDLATLDLRSGEGPSNINLDSTRTPSPSSDSGVYQCHNKADCQTNIDRAKREQAKAQKSIDQYRAKLKAAGKDAAKKRFAMNNLHTATESHAEWQDRIEFYTRLMSQFAS